MDTPPAGSNFDVNGLVIAPLVWWTLTSVVSEKDVASRLGGLDGSGLVRSGTSTLEGGVERNRIRMSLWVRDVEGGEGLE